MVKPISRPYSQHTLNVLNLMGHLLREARLKKALTTSELAERAGISRTLLQRIERGEPGCSIGAVFEVAAICGVPLFESDQRGIVGLLATQKEKMALLPKRIRSGHKITKDDF